MTGSQFGSAPPDLDDFVMKAQAIPGDDVWWDYFPAFVQNIQQLYQHKQAEKAELLKAREAEAQLLKMREELIETIQLFRACVNNLGYGPVEAWGLERCPEAVLQAVLEKAQALALKTSAYLALNDQPQPAEPKARLQWRMGVAEVDGDIGVLADELMGLLAGAPEAEAEALASGEPHVPEPTAITRSEPEPALQPPNPLTTIQDETSPEPEPAQDLTLPIENSTSSRSEPRPTTEISIEQAPHPDTASNLTDLKPLEEVLPPNREPTPQAESQPVREHKNETASTSDMPEPEPEILPPPIHLIFHPRNNTSPLPPSPRPALPPVDATLVRNVEKALAIWLSDEKKYPQAFLLLQWLEQRKPSTTVQLPPASWCQAAYDTFCPASPGALPDMSEVAGADVSALSSEQQAARWMLLAAASLLHGETEETLVLYQNWMEEADFLTCKQVGEAIQAYLRESPLSLAHSIEQIKQPTDRPNPQIYLDAAQKAYGNLTNPTRFGFTKGINMMHTMRGSLEWVGDAMKRRNPSDLEQLRDWAVRLRPNHQITQWDNVSEPKQHRIQGRVRLNLIEDLNTLRNSLRDWVNLVNAPKDTTGERARALKVLAAVIFKEAENWQASLAELSEYYPTLGGFTHLLLCRMITALQPVQNHVQKEKAL